MKRHSYLYLIEFLIIGGGFAVMLALDLNFYTQLIMMVIILVLYVFLGLLHHGKHHDIHPKVVLEYILISVLIFALFIFINITRI